MDVVITGTGMVSSVGHDAPSSCAAIRAGISRPRPLGKPADAAAELPAAVGHPIDGVSNGFAGVGVWKRLADRALRDLARRLPGRDRSDWARAGLVLVLPELDAERFLLDEPLDPGQLREELAEALLGPLGLAIPREGVEVLCRGHAGVLEGLELAAARLARGLLDRVVLLGVDSYLDDCSIEWLAARHRLKLDEVPTGLMPGEAGACFLVEPQGAARRAGRTGQATVAAVASGALGKPWSEPAGRTGAQLARTLRRAVGEGQAFAGDAVLDLNGESWRAVELGSSLARSAPWLAPRRWLTPASSLGDTGAASGAVAVCLAVEGFRRRWSGGDGSLVVSMSDAGGVAAARLTQVPPAAR